MMDDARVQLTHLLIEAYDDLGTNPYPSDIARWLVDHGAGITSGKVAMRMFVEQMTDAQAAGLAHDLFSAWMLGIGYDGAARKVREALLRIMESQ